GDAPADPPEPDDAEGAAPEPVERSRRPVVPLAPPHGGGEDREPAGTREEETERVVGDLLRAVIRHVEDDDVAGGGRPHVDLVVARAVRADDPAALERSHDPGVRLVVLEEERVGLAHGGPAGLGAEA